MEKLAMNDENPYHPGKTANDTHEYKLYTKIRGLEILFKVFINVMLCKKKECVWGASKSALVFFNSSFSAFLWENA